MMISCLKCGNDKDRFILPFIKILENIQNHTNKRLCGDIFQKLFLKEIDKMHLMMIKCFCNIIVI